MTTTHFQWEMIFTELADIVGAEHVSAGTHDKFAYGVDYFWLPEMWVDRGETPPLPDAVVHPGTVEEIAAVVRLANVYRIPVIPWGGGTGSQGGIMPVYGGITVDLKRLEKVLDIDEVSGLATAQAGINGYAFEKNLNEMGLTFPHYPASANGATLGGYIAPRGSGVLSTKYGKIEDQVTRVQVVLPNGDVMRTLPVRAHATGPGILDIFAGAEGTLGIITEATVMVQPLPEARRFRALLFPDVASGIEAGRRIMRDRLGPAVIRLYDEASTVSQVNRVLAIEAKGAYMVLGFDGWADLVEISLQKALAICEDLGAADLGERPGQSWWEHRYDFYFPPHGLHLPWMYGTTDTVTTFAKIEDLYMAKKKIVEEDYAEWDARYIAHFSHWYPWGVMVYDRFIIEQPPADPKEALKLHNELWNACVRASVEHGGVLNEHHGVGLKLSRLMREQYGSAYQVLSGLKQALDPNNLLNPGKLGFGPPR